MKKWNKFFYRTPKGAVDSDSAWKLQNDMMKTNEVYNLVNFSGGGKFIEVWDEGGDDEVYEKKANRLQQYFISSIIPHFLVEENELITEKEYQDWHNRQAFKGKRFIKEKEAQSIGGDVVDADRFDTISRVTLDTVILPFHDHHVKWRLDRRGAVGETPMHLLILNNTEKHTKVAKALLEVCPDLALDLYEASEYYGESILHLAIIQNNIEAVQILLDTNKVDIHSRARGRFFVPVDVKRGDVRLYKRKFQGYAYYGEYPLSFAASVGNREIYDLLLKSGCDPTRKDRYGNNVLHLTVIHDQIDMYYHALKNCKITADPNLTNNDHVTPLALAAKLGKRDMFQKILEISSRQCWCYNTVTCSAYPLKGFDTINRDGSTDWNSALMFIVGGKKEAHFDMVSDPVVMQLLQEKWDRFGRNKFLRLLLLFLLHIATLSTAIYLRPDEPRDLRWGTSARDIARYVFESLVVFMCAGVIFYSFREIYLEGFSGFVGNVKSIPARLFYIVACLMTLICIPMRFAEYHPGEDLLLVFAVPLTWSYFLFFLRNTSLTGPFITTIYRMVGSDMVRFVVIYIICVATASFAFFYQFEGQGVEDFETLEGTAMTLFQMTFGEFDYDNMLSGRYYLLAIFLFVFFMVFVHLLLLNMLIAMMTRTFDKIQKLSEKHWRRQWASMVVTMERSHSNVEKKAFQDSYDLNINATRVTSEGEVDGTVLDGEVVEDTRALMVVQNVEKTESQRRKMVRSTWKKAGKNAKTAPLKATLQRRAEASVMVSKFAGMVGLMSDAVEMVDGSDEDESMSMLDRAKTAVSRTFSMASLATSESDFV